MVGKSKAVFCSFLLYMCFSLMRPTSMASAELRRTTRDNSQQEHYTCSHLGKHDKNHPTGTPSITPSCGALTKYVDDDVYITCKVKSNPGAKITWFFNNKPLAPKHELDITSCSQKLHISYASIADSGAYTCVASNQHGTINKTCHVTIQVRPRRFLINNKGILINGDPSSNKATIGSPLNMTCEVYNADYVYWTKNGVRFPPSRRPSSQNQRISTSKKRVGRTEFLLHLMFARLDVLDRGNYSCVGRDTLLGQNVHSYKYLQPQPAVLAPRPAEKQATGSSPLKSLMPFLVYLVLANLVLLYFS